MGCTIKVLNHSGNKRELSFSKMPKLVLGPNAVSYSMDMGVFPSWGVGVGSKAASENILVVQTYPSPV